MDLVTAAALSDLGADDDDEETAGPGAARKPDDVVVFASSDSDSDDCEGEVKRLRAVQGPGTVLSAGASTSAGGGSAPTGPLPALIAANAALKRDWRGAHPQGQKNKQFHKLVLDMFIENALPFRVRLVFALCILRVCW